MEYPMISQNLKAFGCEESVTTPIFLLTFLEIMGFSIELDDEF